jgi:hypothetical protein
MEEAEDSLVPFARIVKELGCGEKQTTGAHPSVTKLKSLVWGELKRSEAQKVVRHLLRGCPACAEKTTQLWDLRSGPEGRKNSGAANAARDEASLEEARGQPSELGLLVDAKTAAQDELLKLAAELEIIRQKALALCESLPVPPNEGLMHLGEADMDFSTEVRSVVTCVVHDMIEPAIRSFQGAASGET